MEMNMQVSLFKKGDLLDDLRDGEGEYRWKNNDKYKG